MKPLLRNEDPVGNSYSIWASAILKTWRYGLSNQADDGSGASSGAVGFVSCGTDPIPSMLVGRTRVLTHTRNSTATPGPFIVSTSLSTKILSVITARSDEPPTSQASQAMQIAQFHITTYAG